MENPANDSTNLLRQNKNKNKKKHVVIVSTLMALGTARGCQSEQQKVADNSLAVHKPVSFPPAWNHLQKLFTKLSLQQECPLPNPFSPGSSVVDLPSSPA